VKSPVDLGKWTCKIGVFKEENRFQPATILRRRVFTRINYEKADFIRFDSSRAGYHLVLGFRLSVPCKLVAVW
jgi:hypothetical protein